MTQIDFVVALGIMLVVISFSLFYISNILSQNIDETNYKELRMSSMSLGTQLFETQNETNSLGLEEKYNMIQMQFKEIGGHQHTETINIQIQSSNITKVHVYDNFLNYTPASIQYIPGTVDVSFDSDFAPYETKQFNIIYFGGSTSSITYSPANEIQAKIISERQINVISQNNCNYLSSLDYAIAKDLLGFKDEFRFDSIDCSYGLNPPDKANVFPNSIPVLVERQSEIIVATFANLRVW